MNMKLTATYKGELVTILDIRREIEGFFCIVLRADKTIGMAFVENLTNVVADFSPQKSPCSYREQSEHPQNHDIMLFMSI